MSLPRGEVITLPNGAAVPKAAGPSSGTFARLDGIEKELDQLAAGTVELAAAVDAQAQAIVNQIAALADQLAAVQETVNGTALAVALMGPAVTGALGIVTEAEEVGWRRAWKARRKARRQAKAA